MSFHRALAWSIFWIGIAMLVAIGIASFWGFAPAEAFVTGYILEQSLSVDNLFVFLMLFTYFQVSREAQHRALNFGIAGAFVLRGILIFAGLALVNSAEWIFYILGAVVIYTGWIMAFGTEKSFDAETSKTVRFVRRFVPITPAFHGNKFFIRENGIRLATPLFLVVCVIELMDVVFAVDSIPAIFAVTRNPWIVFSSNILAIIGLRSLYFLLERLNRAFRYVKQGVGVILGFIGVKMILPAFWPEAIVSNAVALAVVIGILIVSVVLSVSVNKFRS